MCESGQKVKGLAHLNATQVFELAVQGDAKARKLLQASAEVLANAVTNLSLLLNPSLIIFGGTIGNSEPLLRATQQIVGKNEFARPRLAMSTLGSDAQVHGAIRLALERVEASLFT
jgi:glucokinase